MKITSRASNIELLRILSMFLIVLCHACIHGLKFANYSFSTNYVIAQMLSSGGKLGVNLFILITGYFLHKKEILPSRIFRICKLVWIYSILLFFVAVVFFNGRLDFNSILEVVFAPLYIYWFATAYLLLMVIVPFLNTLISNLDEYRHRQLIIILFFLFSILSFIFRVAAGYSSLSFFCLLYLTGAYFGKNHEIERNTKLSTFISDILSNGVKTNILLLLCVLSLFMSILVFDYLGKYNDIFLDNAMYFTGQASPIIFVLGIIIFIKFSILEIGEIPIINSTASTMFAVYLIHDNKFFRSYLWNNVFNIGKIWGNPPLTFLVKLLFIVLSVFFVCMLIEKIRIYIVNKLSRWII